MYCEVRHVDLILLSRVFSEWFKKLPRLSEALVSVWRTLHTTRISLRVSPLDRVILMISAICRCLNPATHVAV